MILYGIIGRCHINFKVFPAVTFKVTVIKLYLQKIYLKISQNNAHLCPLFFIFFIGYVEENPYLIKLDVERLTLMLKYVKTYVKS